jgi:signal transduction histidine kinase
VKSLAVVPFGVPEPIGALGTYWATRHAPSDREVRILQRLGRALAKAIGTAQEERCSSNALQVREEMLAAAAHELRNAMNTVALCAATLRPAIDESGEPRARQGFARLERLVGNATRLLTSLLDVSRLASGNVRLEYEDVDLFEIVRTVVDRLREEVHRSGSDVTVGGASQVHGQWDRLRLEQIVTNLLSNAIKYGAGNPIGVQLEERDSSASLTVSDEGAGMEEEEQRHIFQPFARGRVGGAPGVGLGLWIVHHLVQAHGGTVVVDSRPRHGSRFTVRLPKYLIDIPRPPKIAADGITCANQVSSLRSRS